MRPIRIALTKGRLEEKTVEMLERLGYDCSNVRQKGRKLIMPIGDGSVEIVLAKAADVVTYVETGAVIWVLWEKTRSWKKGEPFMRWLIWDSADAGLLLLL